MGNFGINGEAFVGLKELIEPEDFESRRQTYRDRKIPRADAVKDIDMRYRWDLYWAFAKSWREKYQETRKYSEVTVDTALKRIVKKL